MWSLARATLIAVVAAANLFVGVSALSLYASTETPAFRMLEDMRALAGQTPGTSPAPTLAMHRRQEFDLRRPIVWSGDRLSGFAARLPAPPKREWLELVNYWNSGGRGDVWFLADPLRSDLALIDDPARRGTYRWSDGISRPSLWMTTLLGGIRPREADWYVIQPPGWYLGERGSLGSVPARGRSLAGSTGSPEMSP
jgi:hypothetical protein